MIKALVFGLIFFLVATFPATWLLMLFAGNVGLDRGSSGACFRLASSCLCCWPARPLRMFTVLRE